MPRAVAINVGANTSLPGFRGPIYPDGSFVYVPIPEREPVAEPVPTYGDLDLPIPLPDRYRDTAVHLDPEFAEYPECEAYTYGDDYGVKARPLLELSAGDRVYFYATLTTADGGDGLYGATAADPEPWIAPAWGAYLIGGFRLDRDPIDPETYRELPEAERARLANNAHVKRETVDAEVFLVGDPEASGLFERAFPLSTPEAGADANRLVTELSADSGKGPWWRRPLRFDTEATAELESTLADRGVALE